MTACDDAFLAEFYFIKDRGAYVEVQHIPNAEDEYGEHVCFIDAGDTMLDVVRKIQRYQRNVGKDD